MHNLKTNFIIFMMVAAAVLPATAIKKVHTIGDSTMANYDENATVTRGWAQYLQQFLTGLTVNNRGKAGASSKSFYEEPAYWKSVKTHPIMKRSVCCEDFTRSRRISDVFNQFRFRLTGEKRTGILYCIKALPFSVIKRLANIDEISHP